jgi:hypothetical protein
MGIKFSRHAKRRMKLYKIPERVIIDILLQLEVSEGLHEHIEEIEGFKYPLKIVFSVQNEHKTVVTTYPLKKGLSK